MKGMLDFKLNGHWHNFFNNHIKQTMRVMKKIFVSAVALLVASVASVSAQKTSTPKTNDLHFGFRAGLNLSNIIKDGDDDFSTEIKPGFNAAAFLEIPLANMVSIQPELQFSQKGYKATGSVLGNPYEYRVTTNYIEIPALVKISPTSQFAILVGPQFSFLTSTKTKFITKNAIYEDAVNEDNDNLRKNILGGVLGIEVSSSNVVFGLRYNLDLQANNEDGSTSTPKYKNQVLGLSVGIRL